MILHHLCDGKLVAVGNKPVPDLPELVQVVQDTDWIFTQEVVS